MHSKKTLFSLLSVFLLCLNSFPQNVNLKNGLISYYPFSYDYKDASGHSFNAAAQLTEFTTDQVPILKPAVRFFRNSIITCKDLNINPSEVNTLTITVWVKPEVSDRRQIIVSNDSAGFGRGILIDNVNNQWGYSAFSGNNSLLGPIPVAKLWTLIIATYDAGNVELRVISASTDKSLNGSADIHHGYNSVCLGNDPLNDKFGLYGNIDEVRFYNRRLNENEIQCLFKSCPVNTSNPTTTTPPPPPPASITTTTTPNPVSPIKDGCNNLPGDPANIQCSVDPNNICLSIKSVKFSTNAIDCADKYEWLLPVTGTVVTNSPIVEMALKPDALSGSVSVKGINKKGAGKSKSLNFKVTPALLPGQNFNIATESLLCGNYVSGTYAVSYPSGYSYSFKWAPPDNSRIESCSSDSSSIVLSVDPKNFSTGNLRVAGIDQCGSSVTAVLGIKYTKVCIAPPPLPKKPCSNLPGIAHPIKCSGDPQNLCLSSKKVTFTTDPIECAEKYVWVLPHGGTVIKDGPSVDMDLVPGFQSGTVTVYGRNNKGIGLTQSLNIRMMPMPDLKTHTHISGESELCNLNKTYTYSFGLPSYNNYSFSWIPPENCRLIKQNENSTSADFLFDKDKFEKGEIKVFGKNKCGNSDTVSFKVKFIGPRALKYDVSGPKTANPGDEAVFSVKNSFERSDKYTWISTKGINILGSAMIVREGTLYNNEVRVRFNDQLDQDTLYIRGYNSTCGLSRETIAIPVKKIQLSGSNYLKPFNKKVKSIRSSTYLNVNAMEITKWKEFPTEDKTPNPHASLSHNQECIDGKGSKNISCSGNNFSFSYKDESGSYSISGELSPKGDSIRTCSISYSGTLYSVTKTLTLNLYEIPGKRFNQKQFIFTSSYDAQKRNHYKDFDFVETHDNPGTVMTSTPIDKNISPEQDCWIYFEFE